MPPYVSDSHFTVFAKSIECKNHLINSDCPDPTLESDLVGLGGNSPQFVFLKTVTVPDPNDSNVVV